MSTPVYSLGNFYFNKLHAIHSREGEPLLPREEIRVNSRPNIPGITLTRMSRRGEEFYMQSTADVANESLARALVGYYYLSVGIPPLDMVWRNVNYTSVYGVKYQVTGIEETRSRYIAAPTGGLAAGNGFVLVSATWRLIGVDA